MFVNVSVFSSLILASIILAYICSTASLRIFLFIVGSCKIDMLRRPLNTMPELTSGIITAGIFPCWIIASMLHDRL
jgi:hypothetical protein